MKDKTKNLVIILVIGLIFPLFLNYSINFINEFEPIRFNEVNGMRGLKTSGVFTGIAIDDLLTSNTTTAGNWTWAVNQPWCEGSGTILDPYIIENHIWNMSTSIDGLKINNSHNRYFVIKNCTFKWNEVTNTIPMTGIYLRNTTHGLIEDNLIYHLGYGIVLEDCEKINITGNTIYDHIDGIYLENSNLNNIIGNNANDNDLGIYLYFCDNNTVSGNIAPNNTEGIYLEESNDNIISGNTANGNSQNGIYLYFCDYNNITENTVNDNYDGIKIDTSSDNNFIEENTANDNDRAGIYSANSDYNNITGNTASGNNNGIFLETQNDNNFIAGNLFYNNDISIELYQSDFNTVKENIAYYNDYYGISLEASNNNTILGNSINNNAQIGIRLIETSMYNSFSGNTIDDNQDGIFIYVANNNTFIGNKIRNNFVRGIHIDEDSDYNEFTENIINNNAIGLNIASLNDNNLVYKNFFLNNGQHAFDDGTNNKWNSTAIGNYWDNYTGPDTSPQDGIVDDPYTHIGGPSGSIDYLPIAEDGAPTIIINSPQGEERFGSTAPSFNVEIIDVTIYEMWYTLDGGLNNYTFLKNGSISQSGWDALADGTVTITFYARDIAGNEAFEEVIVIKVGSTEGLDPGVIATIVVVSVGGVLLAIGAAYMILQKRKTTA